MTAKWRLLGAVFVRRIQTECTPKDCAQDVHHFCFLPNKLCLGLHRRLGVYSGLPVVLYESFDLVHDQWAYNSRLCVLQTRTKVEARLCPLHGTAPETLETPP